MKKKLTIFTIIFTCFFILTAPVNAAKKTTVKLAECVDGDTAKFHLKKEIVTARFLAIDTPETKHSTKGEQPYGEDASSYTCSALTKAKKIVLEYDKNASTDKYDRILVWVFIDGDLLQTKLVQNGLAKVAYLYDKYEYTSLLQKEEKKAKIKKIGIWSNGKAKNEIDSERILTIIAIIIFILFLIFDKKFRKREISSLKKKTKKQIKKGVSDLF